ncbi:MAG: DUF3445 domain-containing protein [Rhodobacterales bacterium]|nr:DUF3445 domain-containing protein [Rhodobacterales bacterium]NCO85185.1 DUF3445 domain-containing protein [Rhodobacterales bacterium]NCT12932.1 DUF3445 domain-containing protein [Rhodobacterales bacterium]
MDDDVILQREIPEDQRAQAMARLPAMQPVRPGAWLQVDEAYAPQLALKARLLATRPGDVLAVLPGAEAAADELLDVVLAEVAEIAGFEVGAQAVARPDGVTVALDRSAPLVTLSRLVQEDLCILHKQGSEHVLTAALLCFPAAWTLAEKIGRPLGRIHTPVPRYDADVAARVQRMFDMVGGGRVLWRANLLRYDDPALFQPHTEAAPRAVGHEGSPYERSERQTILRLPQTGAVIFSIHTKMIRRRDATVPDAR